MSTPTPKSEIIARVCHNVNRAYCAATGDLSQPEWDAAPKWQRESAISGVEAHLHEPMTPEQSHAAWSAHKLADGWKHGPVKDPVAKEHPCLVPYGELPSEQRVKDYLFAAIVESMR